MKIVIVQFFFARLFVKKRNPPNGEFLSLARPKGFALRACSFATQTVAFYVSRVSAKANRREIDYRGSNPFPLFVKKRNPPKGDTS